MILYLLCPLLIAGIKSQTVNVTVEERSRADENVPSSLYQEGEGLIEEELENNNQMFIREDDEMFQDQDTTSPHRDHCDRALLVFASHSHCGEPFHNEMFTISSENWCHQEHISSPYRNLTLCLEKISDLVNCLYPNQDTEDFFLSIHSQYFQDCSTEKLVFEDAPHWVAMVLTLIPVSIIPVLVYLVVWKSKVQE
ncbi:receptor activity-modifying protein 3 [Hippoglossus stenolepis]|uniref:receptor activity-modifying protein 3 n=1 Tax=Hippoglossus stenolepis TaxID=195615 RepID=UPI00159CAC0E|nr:receptor activity-modifying protein 3 [Hippoglossus stenolepis]